MPQRPVQNRGPAPNGFYLIVMEGFSIVFCSAKVNIFCGAEGNTESKQVPQGWHPAADAVNAFFKISQCP